MAHSETFPARPPECWAAFDIGSRFSGGFLVNPDRPDYSIRRREFSTGTTLFIRFWVFSLVLSFWREAA